MEPLDWHLSKMQHAEFAINNALALKLHNPHFLTHTIHQFNVEVTRTSFQHFTHNSSLPGGLHSQLVHMMVPEQDGGFGGCK